MPSVTAGLMGERCRSCSASPIRARLPRPIAAAPLWEGLSRAIGWPIDTARSQLFPQGRAAAFAAMQAGRERVLEDPQAIVMCGAADTYADRARIDRERGTGRTLGGDEPTDGRVLGEGAAFTRLGAARAGTVLELADVGIAHDPGHRFGDAPAYGEGLADAVEDLRGRDESGETFARVWAGLTGESHEAKLWSVACLRHHDLFAPKTQLSHPADRFGDAGAGLGALLFASAVGDPPAAGQRSLLWAASDFGACGCASVAAATTGA